MPPPRPRPAPDVPPGAFSATAPAGTFAPQPPAGPHVPPAGSAAATEPDWLAQHLERSAAQQPEPNAVSGWTRRALGWSLGVSLLASVLAGALWLYEDRRVEGALGVVAATSAPEDEAAPAVLLKNTAAAVAVTPAPPPPAPTSASVPDATPAAAETSAVQPAAVEPPAVPPREETAQPDAAPAPARRTRAHVRHARKVTTAAAPAASPASAVPREPAEPSPRQRREETLMQCRAHGYDDRQCVARGCEMTRFGFACRG